MVKLFLESFGRDCAEKHLGLIGLEYQRTTLQLSNYNTRLAAGRPENSSCD